MRKIVPVPALRHLVPPNVEQLLDSQILDVAIAEDYVGAMSLSRCLGRSIACAAR